MTHRGPSKTGPRQIQPWKKTGSKGPGVKPNVKRGGSGHRKTK